MAKLKQQYPQTLEVLKLDATSKSDVESAFQKISPVAVASLSLVNNAGLALGGPIEVIDLDEWRKLFDVNVFGLLRMTQVFLPLLRIPYPYYLVGKGIHLQALVLRLTTVRWMQFLRAGLDFRNLKRGHRPSFRELS